MTHSKHSRISWMIYFSNMVLNYHQHGKWAASSDINLFSSLCKYILMPHWKMRNTAEIVYSLKLINARKSIKINRNIVQIYRPKVLRYANKNCWNKAGKAWWESTGLVDCSLNNPVWLLKALQNQQWGWVEALMLENKMSSRETVDEFKITVAQEESEGWG